MFHQVTASIQGFGDFSPGDIAAILERLKRKTVEKNGLLIGEGQICQTFYFIQQGYFRHYTVQDNGEEATLNLLVEGEWVFEYKSFISQQPSENIIQAVTCSEVYGLHVSDFHGLIKLSNGFFRLGQIFGHATRNQEFQTNRLSPEQKYERLLLTKPELLQHFPLKHIASYLGITPETLSRIRKKISS